MAFLALIALSARAADLPRVRLKLIAEGMASPVAYVELPDGNRLIVDQVGPIWALDGEGRRMGEPVADVSDKMVQLREQADERGLLDLVPHPQFESNRRVFVFYSAPVSGATPGRWSCESVVAEFTLPKDLPLRLDMKSEKVLLRFGKPSSNHNGGRMAFGPDGLLYIGVGDGGGANDEGQRPSEGNGQFLRTWMGKILRMDVDHGSSYSVPQDNPFAGGREGLPEIYAYGFRNPWGLSFDRGGAREFFVADVGQNLFEEVDIVVKGGNYGWKLREGFHPFSPRGGVLSPEEGERVGARGELLVDPILEYPHNARSPDAVQGICVIGGHVYRGREIPGLVGRYVFGNWGRNWAVGEGRLIAATRAPDSSRWDVAYLPVASDGADNARPFITAMSEGRDGELYVLTSESRRPHGRSGKVWKIAPVDQAAASREGE